MTTNALAKPGTLVSARGREWVVLPDSQPDLLKVRPLGGLDEEVTGIMPEIEAVTSSTFPLPGREDLGDFSSGRLLRDAARLTTRSAAGPFRSFGRIAVEPRPYQLVPLMMALKLDPVRLLLADDVGIGKTVEAALIIRELLDRGEIQRLAVLCPPHLAGQWQQELKEKFHIEAELILSSTIQRLERSLPVGVSVFDRHRFTVVSTDFIKSSRRAEDFILKCPECVIVDEAHGCTLSGGSGRGRQQRYELLKRISRDTSRHLVLVTATPHSGNEDAFRSLLSLIDESFVNLPIDLDKAGREGARRRLARHLVQRRRADIRHFLETDTAFPERCDKEITYSFSQDYADLFRDILSFARSYVAVDGGERYQRVRYWSALALLRCVSSSPAAAAATLRSRAAVDDAEDSTVDEIGRRTVLDQDDADDVVTLDMSPGSDMENASEAHRRKLLAFARRAEGLPAQADNKLQEAMKQIKQLVRDGFRPVVFCRFVDTAEYVTRHLRDALPARVQVQSVTGLLPPAEREDRITRMVEESEQYALVCTDCLSEGINLQQFFDAVFHYDLAWNPTRHEQREGRVDRFGQDRPEVRVVTYYGKDNPIDGVILDVLIRKHKRIKSALGITIAVPSSSEEIAEALFEGALFREQTHEGPQQLTLDFIDDLDDKKEVLHREWDNARDREKASRSRFAQHTLNPEDVAQELDNVRQAIGRGTDVARFFHGIMHRCNIPVKTHDEAVEVHLSLETDRDLRQAIGRDQGFRGRFDLPLEDGEIYLGRTSPIIEGLASWTLDLALDPEERDGAVVGSRCGVIRTAGVAERTQLLLTRFRFHLKTSGKNAETLLCEEIVPLACQGRLPDLRWLPEEEAEQLLALNPEDNLPPTLVDQQLQRLIPSLPEMRDALSPLADERALLQLRAHERVREAGRRSGKVSIEPVLPVDILGAYILLPRVD